MSRVTTALKSIRPYLIGILAGVLAIVALQKYQWYQANKQIIAFCVENKDLVGNINPDLIKQVKTAQTQVFFEKTSEDVNAKK